ncbi:MAG: hypothetical protein NZ772_08460 [Cyanobacteria bacterium]|nr:hypothetical protein [Cyanobacteriota bacterium]MDW8201509.1 hypothetical protein [Cyanobacteriota bacterium SKYGB_h_bin112]
MARYTSLFKVAAPVDDLQPAITNVLEACNMRVIYRDNDYLVAREIPGQVTFAKLVTVEVLIDRPREHEAKTGELCTPSMALNFVVKNEELPLQANNHCRRMFELVNNTLLDSNSWELLEHVSS